MTTTKKKRPASFSRQLKSLGACEDAVAWVGKKSLAVAWRKCERPQWMFWLLERSDGWSLYALNACLLDFMADALESARPSCGKEAYWPQTEAAHRLVREAIAGCGDLAVAKAAARAAAGAIWAAMPTWAPRAAAGGLWVAIWAARAALAAEAARAAWAAARAAKAAKAAEAAAWAVARSVGAAEAAWVAIWAARAAAGAAANKRLANIVRKHFPKAPRLKEVA